MYQIQIPNILRARGFRLYLADSGKHTGQARLVDLWLNGGAAVLGHTPPNLLRELKNAVNRGLYAPYPHFTESRFLKALSKLFPQRSFRLYAAPPQELTLYTRTTDLHGLNGFTRIKEESDKKSQVNFEIWRPFVDPANPFFVDSTPVLVPVIPGIQTWRDGLPLGLCVVAASSEDLLTRLPPGDMLSPILLAVATRGVYDLLAAKERAKLALPRIKKALRENSTKKEWRQNGIYLTLKHDPTPEEWAAMFHQFLDAGFLLPPTSSHPLILPGEMSDGEEAKLAKVL